MTTKNVTTKGLEVIEHGNALALDPNKLEATRNFFYSNSFDIELIDSELHLFFAQSSNFLNSHINMAIEVVFPINHAVQGLYQSVFVEPSNKGTQPFFNTVANNNKNASALYGASKSSFELKEIDKFQANVHNFRQVNANYARFAYAVNEGMIEFYEANPILIHTLTNRVTLRANDGIHSVFAVIGSSFMLEALLIKMKNILEPLYKKFQEEA